ncbi:MAG: class I SAM-dependent methyltransferase [Mariprofundaceae bacterium]
MHKNQRKRIVDKHRDSLTRHGHHANALYWSSREVQEIRFQALTEIGVESGDSVLDIGCGFGDLLRWFEAQDQLVDFTGIDLSPDLIRVAQEKHPNAALLCGELDDFDFELQSFDWVVLSGALNEQLHDDGAYARKTIASMYGLCCNGLAFNLLDGRSLKAHDLQSHLPQEMLDYCKGLCANTLLRDDYLDNDFTVYMRKA